MKRRYFTVLVAVSFVLVLGLSAWAQGEDAVNATVPYDFVAGGELLPAGSYRVTRIDGFGQSQLRITNRETGAGAFLIPSMFVDAPAENVQLSLQSVGGKYFLKNIHTLNGVYTLAIPRSVTKLAQMEQHGSTSSSGSN